MAVGDYSKVIERCEKEIDKLFRKPSKWSSENETIIQVFNIYYTAIYQQIHNKLALEGRDSSEKKIRDIIKRNVIGYRDNRKGISFIGAIDPLRAKLKQVSGKKKLKDEFCARYAELYDNFMALASYRSFKHYCLYFEECYAPEDKKIWVHADAHGIAEGMWYCFNSMALNGDFKNMFKQTPTGYFKTYSNICFISWLFGIDRDTDVLYILGNPSMVKKVFIGIKQQMLRPKYAKVFPYYEQFECQEEKMFVINNLKEGELLICGANSMCNFKIASKDTAIDGVRFKWRFYDDITRSMDKNNVTKHARDNELYHDDWTKRQYTEFSDFEVFSGTAYSPYDLINTQKARQGEDETVNFKNFKYCKVNKKTATMFVKIPKLDYETDESTLPEKYTTEAARRERERDAETFAAMEQQDPAPPSGLPFDWKYLKTYTELPDKLADGGKRSNVCRAVLDPSRTGHDKLSLGIHSRCGEYEYLVDCFYRKLPLDAKMEDGRTALDHICDKIIAKNVVELAVENNTVSNIKTQIENLLFARGYRICKIVPIYSTQKKADKIFDNQTTIREHIIFPHKKLFAPASMMGQYMKDITTWHEKTKENDDSIDTEAIFSDVFVRKNSGVGVVATPFSR